MTMRGPDGGAPFLTCTNHYRKRAKPVSCDRYALLTDGLGEVHRAGAQGKTRPVVTQKMGWSMLDAVAMSGLATHHSVIFEPNKTSDARGAHRRREAGAAVQARDTRRDEAARAADRGRVVTTHTTT